MLHTRPCPGLPILSHAHGYDFVPPAESVLWPQSAPCCVNAVYEILQFTGFDIQKLPYLFFFYRHSYFLFQLLIFSLPVLSLPASVLYQ